MDYGLWLLCDDDGTIALTGWSENPGSDANPTADTKTDRWRTYTLCQDRTQLPGRLAELGLDLDAGADINDFDKGWDVYVRHPDITALRAKLDSDRTRKSG
jgi:hypothetical protein